MEILRVYVQNIIRILTNSLSRISVDGISVDGIKILLQDDLKLKEYSNESLSVWSDRLQAGVIFDLDHTDGVFKYTYIEMKEVQ